MISIRAGWGQGFSGPLARTFYRALSSRPDSRFCEVAGVGGEGAEQEEVDSDSHSPSPPGQNWRLPRAGKTEGPVTVPSMVLADVCVDV